MLLDCCFAGRAIVGAMGDAPDLADMSQVEGTYLLAAASATQAAVAPPGERYTAFTGELLDILDTGIRTPHAYLDFGRIHDDLVARLSAKGRPIPRQRNDGHGSRIILARNRQAPDTVEIGGVPGPLRELLAAQERAASKFPYRLYGAPANALATVYVRQQTRSYVSDRERGRTEPEPRDAHDAPQRGPERDRAASGRTADLHAPEPSWRAPTARSTAPAPLRAVDEILDVHRHLLIIGGPGQGKSTLTLQLAASLAAEFRADDNASLLPLRVTAARLADLEGPWNTRVERALTDELGPFLDSPLPADLLSRLPADGTRLLIVDGLDEITNPEQRRSFIAMLGSRLQDEDVPYRLLITSRPLPQNELEFLNQLALGTYTLEPFGREQVAEFAGRWFGDTPGGRRRAQAFLHQLARTGVRELSRVPLLATIAAIVFGEGSDTSLPASRFRLYEQYFAYLDRAQTGRHHEEQARILNDLKFTNPVHVQSVSLLFANRRRLVEHLADSVVKVRDPNEEPRDLLRTALAWLDTHGCRPTRLQLPQWQTLVATHIGASGLFVLQGDRLRFVHYTFAEHIAAGMRARILPPEFDAENEAWDGLLTEAFDANLQAWAVIVHHSNLAGSGDELLVWLNSGGTRHQALAGTLLASGIEADERHASRFVEHVVQRLCGNLSLPQRIQIQRDVAGLIQHPEMRTAIERYLWTGYRTQEARLELAEAIGPEAPYLVIDVMTSVLRDAQLPGAHRADAARVLVELDPAGRGEAAEFLRVIIASADAVPEDRRRAAAALVSIAPRFRRRSRRRTDLGDRFPAEPGGRTTASSGGARLVRGSHVEAAGLALHRIASSRSARMSEVCDAAESLANLGGHYAEQAAACLREAARSPDPSRRWDAASSLARCGSRYVDDAAHFARGIAADPDCSLIDRTYAAMFLASTGDAAYAVEALRPGLRDEHRHPAERRAAAKGLAEIDEGWADEAAAALTGLFLDVYDTARSRAESASALARLGRAHRASAVALLRAAACAVENPIALRVEFLAALGLMDPAHNAEATAALHELVDDPAVDWADQRHIAGAFTKLGVQNTERVAAILRRVAGSPEAPQPVRCGAGEDLAALGPAYVVEAAGFSTVRSVRRRRRLRPVDGGPRSGVPASGARSGRHGTAVSGRPRCECSPVAAQRRHAAPRRLGHAAGRRRPHVAAPLVRGAAHGNVGAALDRAEFGLPDARAPGTHGGETRRVHHRCRLSAVRRRHRCRGTRRGRPRRRRAVRTAATRPPPQQASHTAGAAHGRIRVDGGGCAVPRRGSPRGCRPPEGRRSGRPHRVGVGGKPRPVLSPVRRAGGCLSSGYGFRPCGADARSTPSLLRATAARSCRQT
ncbi:NACHT domain-containing protein [Yinghuangia aomiensis]